MKNLVYLTFVTLLSALFSYANARTFKVASLTEFNESHAAAKANDIILWKSGEYKDITMNITKNDLIIAAELPGKTIFSGASYVNISGNNVLFKDFQYINGTIKSRDVIKITGSRTQVSAVNISGYTCGKYLVIHKKAQYVKITKCNFENKLNVNDKNIIAISVNKDQPGMHKIQYCSFKNFEGFGGDMGIEPIRIGSSYESQYDSMTTVEYCYFTNCNGDGEIISNKSGKNIIRYNYFYNNPLAEVVLRHGSETYIYGNFFYNGKGGIRVTEGGKHYIFNNYFTGLTNTSIQLQNSKDDPLSSILIYHNTFVATAKVKLGKAKANAPKKVVLANNLFYLPKTSCISHPTGKEKWIGNVYDKGNLGIPKTKGIQKKQVQLVKNELAFYQLQQNSSLIDTAAKGYPQIPELNALQIDASIAHDIVKGARPLDQKLKDVGCQEYTTEATFKPLATSENTGPGYLQSL